MTKRRVMVDEKPLASLSRPSFDWNGISSPNDACIVASLMNHARIGCVSTRPNCVDLRLHRENILRKEAEKRSGHGLTVRPL
jgi:hypothetical protein